MALFDFLKSKSDKQSENCALLLMTILLLALMGCRQEKSNCLSLCSLLYWKMEKNTY